MASAGRLLILVENLPVPFDRRVWQEVISLRNAGYRVSIICPKGKGYSRCFEILEGVCIYRYPFFFEARGAVGYLFEYSYALIWQFILSIKVFFEQGFDVIQACNPPDLIFMIGLFYKVMFGKKFVFDHHDINPELYLAKGGNKDLFYRMLILFERLTFRLADISIATNNSYKKIALSRGKKREEDVFVVRTSPIIENMECFIPDKPDVNLKRGKKYLVVYVGVMAKQDGVDYLLRAADYIVNREKRDDILFVLIGEGPEWKELVKYSIELRLQNYVIFTGRISDKEMVNYLHACDVCVNPDVVNEFNDKSTMNKVLEYMALGKPIVQFDMRESRYSAQQASLYAKANDEEDFSRKILELLGDKKLREKMGQTGRKRIKEELSWEFSGLELIKAYRYLFNKRYKTI